MITGDGGLAACLYMLCEIHTTLGDLPVTVSVRTDYPFKEEFAYEGSQVLIPETEGIRATTTPQRFFILRHVGASCCSGFSVPRRLPRANVLGALLTYLCEMSS